MCYSYIPKLLLISIFFSHLTFGFEYRSLVAKDLKAKVRKPCSVVHFWASWCEVCVQELPKLLPFLMGKKKTELVVIDLSHELAQEKFSSVWLKKIAPESNTYHKGKASDEDLVGSIYPGWSGGLPLTLLFVKGKLKQAWTGSVLSHEIDTSLKKHCSDKK